MLPCLVPPLLLSFGRQVISLSAEDKTVVSERRRIMVSTALVFAFMTVRAILPFEEMQNRIIKTAAFFTVLGSLVPLVVDARAGDGRSFDLD